MHKTNQHKRVTSRPVSPPLTDWSVTATSIRYKPYRRLVSLASIMRFQQMCNRHTVWSPFGSHAQSFPSHQAGGSNLSLCYLLWFLFLFFSCFTPIKCEHFLKRPLPFYSPTKHFCHLMHYSTQRLPAWPPDPSSCRPCPLFSFGSLVEMQAEMSMEAFWVFEPGFGYMWNYFVMDFEGFIFYVFLFFLFFFLFESIFITLWVVLASVLKQINS